MLVCLYLSSILWACCFYSFIYLFSFKHCRWSCEIKRLIWDLNERTALKRPNNITVSLVYWNHRFFHRRYRLQCSKNCSEHRDNAVAVYGAVFRDFFFFLSAILLVKNLSTARWSTDANWRYSHWLSKRLLQDWVPASGKVDAVFLL